MSRLERIANWSSRSAGISNLSWLFMLALVLSQFLRQWGWTGPLRSALCVPIIAVGLISLWCSRRRSRDE